MAPVAGQSIARSGSIFHSRDINRGRVSQDHASTGKDEFCVEKLASHSRQPFSNISRPQSHPPPHPYHHGEIRIDERRGLGDRRWPQSLDDLVSSRPSATSHLPSADDNPTACAAYTEYEIVSSLADPASVKGPAPEASNSSMSPDRLSYEDEIERLRQYMPHLKHVGEPSRAHNSADIDCWDYGESGTLSMQSHSSEPNSHDSNREFARIFTEKIPSDVRSRYLSIISLVHWSPCSVAVCI